MRNALVAALLLPLLLAASADAFPLELRDRSPHARYAVWVSTSLDLAEPGQPTLVVPFGDSDVVDVSWQEPGPHWVFLSERFQPVGGPPVDLLLPLQLLPFDAPPEALSIASVDPEVLTRRERISVRPRVLAKVLLACLLVLGGGLGLRRFVSFAAARTGRRSAPLEDRHAPATSAARLGLAVALLLAFALRMPGFFSESLDLLEVSYLPGIGRPAPFAEGASGLSALFAMLRELAALYCLDLTHPPLYHAVLGFMGLLSSAGWILRVPGLLASLASVWLSWRLGRRISDGAGLAGALLVAVAAPSVYFGQDATPYAFVGLVALGAVDLMLRALETGSAARWLGFYGLLVAGFLSHYNVAPFGMALCVLLVVWCLRGRGDRRWLAALHLSLGRGLVLAPLPLSWAWLHFSTFDTVAQDTRLVADTYMPDPGWASYLFDFVQVTAGLDAGGPWWPLLGLLPLVGFGLWGLRAEHPRLAQALALLAITFLASTLFFYLNAREHLGGRIFYGFRWVGWYHPVLLLTAALGFARGPGPLPLRAGLLALWLAGALPATWDHVSTPSRPDYEGAAALILDELEDGDGVATLPAWFQRGNLAWYLFRSKQLRRRPQDGEGAWDVGGKRLTLEPIHPGLPFETTARSSHVPRLWVAVVEEEMFGRPKFDPRVAAQALAWADEHMEPDGTWTLDRLTLHRYRVRGPLVELPIELHADTVPLLARTYPPIPDRGLEPAIRLRPRPPLGPLVRLQAPMTPTCFEELPVELEPIPHALQPEADTHWAIDLRLERGAQVEVEGVGKVSRQRIAEGLRVRVLGLPCDDAAPVVRLLPEAP